MIHPENSARSGQYAFFGFPVCHPVGLARFTPGKEDPQ
jgi:hypothetical protein